MRFTQSNAFEQVAFDAVASLSNVPGSTLSRQDLTARLWGGHLKAQSRKITSLLQLPRQSGEKDVANSVRHTLAAIKAGIFEKLDRSNELPFTLPEKRKSVNNQGIL